MLHVNFSENVKKSNGYPRKLVDGTIKKSRQTDLKKQIETSLHDDNAQDTEEPEDNPGYFDTLNVPLLDFLRGFQKNSDI